LDRHRSLDIRESLRVPSALAFALISLLTLRRSVANGLYGGAAAELSQLNTSIGRTWGVGPSVSWSFPNMAGPRARVRQAKAAQAAALASFDAVVLTALKEVEQSLSLYGAALANRQALSEARERIHSAFDIATAEFGAGAVSNLDLLTTEQSLVTLDAAVAAADSALIQDQIAVFKALGGGWHDTGAAP
jgi:outer membrane protein TolC